MLINFYSIDSRKNLQIYLLAYIPLVQNIALGYGLDLSQNNFKCDHVGVQTISAEEFEDGSIFFKTKLINLIEIEFRNDKLGE